MSIEPEASAPSIDNPSGIQKVSEWAHNPNGINLDSKVYYSSHEVKPLVRGVPKPVTVSLASLFSRHPVFRWKALDPEGFSRVATRDWEIKASLKAVDELVDSTTSMGPQDNRSRELYTLALTEKAAEIGMLASPYIPKVFAKEETKEANPEESENRDVIVEDGRYPLN